MNKTVVIRGAGDLASGIAHRLYSCGFNVLMLDIKEPLVIRRTVAFADAIFNGTATVEGVTGVLCESIEDIEKAFKDRKIAVIIDEKCQIVKKFKVDALVDAILAKRNIGTFKGMAPIVIGLGPGFTAGEDVDAVVETNRGHYLGKLILNGSAEPNTGAPGNIMGYTLERVINAPATGRIHHNKNIGDVVKKDEVIATIDGTPVRSKLDGALRGLIREGTFVKQGLKIADTDPRGKVDYCYEISEKARAIGGGVLEAILHLSYRRENSEKCIS
ncbi:selenium-dependent molybdenum cofactor biosynthesis protein YqeB [Clostridium cylindrosporum]|uniref:Selenium-dependent molybdenum hydroxylase system protein, YqeB family n=1 Tax=Clostridium cylindrosporum DSM 605 TaxID=1121307 RepID=A0A0J8DCU7_CLOCY|nr:selenium-dependent molybdenum cofactor biosynthesis protein YqeB [Clostridium cylindrosporum]KMT22079.1 selenium-dependent molybdenum hydroxylase system protein, YqeB family [Clostridium cylindrosporum DSM 605]